jgi:hypothetical protein
MNEFMSMLFYIRDYAQKMHLVTDSFSDYMALEDIYHNLTDCMDKLAEVYQGKHGLLKDIPIKDDKYLSTPAKQIRANVEWLEEMRYELCDKNDAMMQAVVDTIIQCLYQALYKLENFK